MSGTTPFFVSEKARNQRLPVSGCGSAPDERTRDAPDGWKAVGVPAFVSTHLCRVTVEGWYRQGADINTLLQHLSYTRACPASGYVLVSDGDTGAAGRRRRAF